MVDGVLISQDEYTLRVMGGIDPLTPRLVPLAERVCKELPDFYGAKSCHLPIEHYISWE